MCVPRQANSTEPVALRSPHYRVRRLLQDSGKNAAAKEEVVQGTQAANIAAAMVVWLPNEGMRFLL
jgi:hypothetical protein